MQDGSEQERCFQVTEILDGERVPAALPVGSAGTVVTVGTFDGVHRGHLAVIAEVRERAAALGAKSALVTFEPHPLAVLRPEAAPPRLTTFDEKKALLGQAGLDYVIFLPFTSDLAALSAREFVEGILVERLRLRHLVIGFDHRLGRGRGGDPAELRAIGEELGFTTDVVGAVLLDELPVSSTRIREALAAGDVREAARELGRPYSFQGEVVRGDGRGRGLGFPTANLRLADQSKLLPLDGIYAVHTTVRGERLQGVLHLGPRPTFPGASRSVELHLLDFDAEIYGEVVEVEFYERIREIRAFDSIEALIYAMTDDCDKARALFAAGVGACQ